MRQSIVPIILSGGIGSRLWPLSNHKTPKQFLNLGISSHSLLQETLTRVAKFNPALIVSNQEHRFLLKENLQKVNYSAENILLEPCLRNTAPAIACAALYLQAQESDALMLVLPADHLIKNPEKFEKAVQQASILANLGYLVTFGIQPTSPETGYGYIKMGETIGNNAHVIEKFIEKPDIKTARQYVADSQYLWNSGMFLFSAKTYLEELEKLHPQILHNCQQSLAQAQYNNGFCWLGAEGFAKNPNISIDYAVMEFTKRAAVVQLDCEWSDIGSWDSLWKNVDKNLDENAKIGEIYEHETTNSYLHAHQIPIATLGVDNLVIISCKNMVLVADKSRVQEIKLLMEQMAPKETEYYEQTHPTIRPWGEYKVLTDEKHYKVKQVTVKTGEKLSLQKHQKRDENWTILNGSARVTIGETQQKANKNDHIHIPANVIHSIENIGEDELVFVEIQTGSYLGEDDIIRYNDRYGRIENQTRLESQIAPRVIEATAV